MSDIKLSAEELKVIEEKRQETAKIAEFATKINELMDEYDATIIIDPNSLISKPMLLPILRKNLK